MDTDVITDLHVGLIGRPVEIGIYEKNTDEWIATDAGILTSYVLTPEKNTVLIARSSTESSGSSWDPTEHYIAISIITK